MSNIYEFSLQSIDDRLVSLSQYKNQFVLIVNTASKCGFTPQYQGLEDLYKKYSAKGFTILGIPCNQFGGQEPGNSQEISEFCSVNFKISFPMFAKVSVNGPDEHPLYTYLKTAAPGLLGSKSIKWNFTKFLVDRSGVVVKRFSPTDSPASIDKYLSNLI
jgi:glutathione peroxidase